MLKKWGQVHIYGVVWTFSIESCEYRPNVFPLGRSLARIPIFGHNKGFKITIVMVWAWKMCKKWGKVHIYWVVWTFSIESNKYRLNAFPLGQSLAQISIFWAQKRDQNNNFHCLSTKNVSYISNCILYIYLYLSYPIENVHTSQQLVPKFYAFSMLKPWKLLFWPLFGPKKGKFRPGIAVIGMHSVYIYKIPLQMSTPSHKCALASTLSP